MEGVAGGFHDDWDLLLDSPSSDAHRVAGGGFDSILEGDDDYSSAGGFDSIRADYFSIDGFKSQPDEPADFSAENNASWVEPQSAEPWSVSGSDLSDGRKFSDFGTAEGQKDGGFDGLDLGAEPDGESATGFGFDAGKLIEFDASKTELPLEDMGDITSPGRNSSASQQFGSDSDRERSPEEISGEDELRAEQKDETVDVETREGEAIEKAKPGAGPAAIRRIAWWKVPYEVLRYCVLRVGPVWSFSVAAAMVGLIILGRRLHKMKQKSRTLQLKVTLDDKKVLQFKSRAARLNEAFSVVRRVPVVRPALPGPAAGVAPSWPTMSLR